MLKTYKNKEENTQNLSSYILPNDKKYFNPHIPSTSHFDHSLTDYIIHIAIESGLRKSGMIKSIHKIVLNIFIRFGTMVLIWC